MISLLSMIIFFASQVGTPGPANMALMATGARFGLRPALAFVAGVVIGKQLIIWPIGFGLMGVLISYPFLFTFLKFASAAYIIYLAWKVANLRLNAKAAGGVAPGFSAGLIVHPLNPKAWAMIIAGFTSFVTPNTDPLIATASIGGILMATQLFFHPLWALAGDRIARSLAGTAAEPYLMYSLAFLTVASVLFVLFGGGI